MEVVGREIRRIADDQVEHFFLHRREPVACQESDSARGKPRCVLARNIEGARVPIDGRYRHQRTLVGDGQRDRATAGAEVEYPQWRIGSQALQGEFDQPFRLRPRYQRIARHHEGQRPEFLRTQDMRDGLAANPSRNQIAKADLVRLWKRIVGVGIEPRPGLAEGMCEQDLRFGARLPARKPPGGEDECVGDGGLLHQCIVPDDTTLTPPGACCQP